MARSQAALSVVPDDVSDAKLVAMVLAGERERYALLVRRYQTPLYRHALGMVQDQDAAADLVQDTLLKAYTSLASCRDPSRFRIWVFQILRNRCLDYLKNRRRKNASLDDYLNMPSDEAGPESDLERSALRSALDRAIAALPEAQREAFLLKHVQDLSYDEMSEVLGASTSALKMRVLRAREMLQALLRGEDVVIREL